METKAVYNLEFPLHVDSFYIKGYHFYKVGEYQERRQGLQQLVNITDDQVIVQNTGSHQQTGFVEIPEEEKESILHQDFEDSTELTDILLFISLFTRRDVFVLDINTQSPIIADPRMYAYGGGLVCSLPYKSEVCDEESGRVLSQEEINSDNFLWEERDLTLPKGISEVVDLINTEKWQNLYGEGYYLRLYKSAIKLIDPYIPFDIMNFVQSWTIWEHIFALNHKNVMNEREIYITPANKKIDFILTNYFDISTTIQSKSHVDRLVKARNRIVHFGKHSSNLKGTDILAFIRSTEALIAMTLDLPPSNVLNYQEKLKNLLFP